MGSAARVGSAEAHAQVEVRYYTCLTRADLSVQFSDKARTQAIVRDWKNRTFTLKRDRTDPNGLGFQDTENRVYLFITGNKALYGLIDKGHHCLQTKTPVSKR